MTRTLLIAALFALAGCNRTTSRRSAPGAQRPPLAPMPPVDDRVPPARFEDHPDLALDAAERPDVEAPTAAAADDAGAPGERTVEGAGVRVVLRADHMVEIHTTDNWDAAVDQVFESCEFVRNGAAALRRTMPADRVDVILRACGGPRAAAPVNARRARGPTAP